MDESGVLVGMVTSNTKHVGTGRSLPHLNFSLHAAALRPIWALLKAGPLADVRAMRLLDIDSLALRRLWALSAHLSPGNESHNATQRLQQLLKDKSISTAELVQQV